MSFNDARFNSHNSYKTSYVKDPNWEWLRQNLVLVLESAPPSSRQRGVRASERGSQLLNLKRSASQFWEQLSKTMCKYIRRISRYNSVPDWNEINLRHYMYPYVPLRGGNKYNPPSHHARFEAQCALHTQSARKYLDLFDTQSLEHKLCPKHLHSLSGLVGW